MYTSACFSRHPHEGKGGGPPTAAAAPPQVLQLLQHLTHIELEVPRRLAPLIISQSAGTLQLWGAAMLAAGRCVSPLGQPPAG